VISRHQGNLSDYDVITPSGVLLPSVAQPPLPLQEFFFALATVVASLAAAPVPYSHSCLCKSACPFSASRVWMATPALVGALLAA